MATGNNNDGQLGVENNKEKSINKFTLIPNIKSEYVASGHAHTMIILMVSNVQ